MSTTCHHCAKILADNDLSIAFIESATAGYLANQFSLTPYSGEVLQGGLVCYDGKIKIDVLGVSQALIDEFTAESMPVTDALAKNAHRLFDANLIVACTGLLTKGGSETPDKPVGTFFYSIYYQGRCHSFQTYCQGHPKKKLKIINHRICQSLVSLIGVVNTAS